ncbi:MAG: bifunctional phosphoserine phosphatase/homoserine phosphotransferase ThrH [Pseudomonadales bacterium]|nr:bifunctional phosphoserine phosphatase/homoserine phosphotransferase ThrH [Pseudomonadales bacterium]
MDVLCLDLEGVLVPEVWQAVADKTGVPGLLKTTRDIPIYDDLMQYRLGLLREHDIALSTIQAEIDAIEPLPGAVDFLAWARERYQVVIVSDTFYEFGMPLMAKLGYPTLLCHRLEVEGDRIIGYQIRQRDPKRCSVQALKSLNYRIFAAGDSFNDVSMLEEADVGIFFSAPENVTSQFPSFRTTQSYAELQHALLSAA